MSLFFSYHGRQHDLDGGASRPQATLASWPMLAKRLRVLTRRATGRTFAVCRIIHQGIVNAKTRRPPHDVVLQAGSGDDWSLGESAQEDRNPAGTARFPQPPLFLDEKWDS
jgi:hypothetical protein